MDPSNTKKEGTGNPSNTKKEGTGNFIDKE